MGEKRNVSHTHQVQLFYHELTYITLFLMIQIQILVGDLHRDHWGHLRHHVFANNSQLRTRDMEEESEEHGRCLIVFVLSRRID